MARLEELQPGTIVKGILPNQHVTVVTAHWRRDAAIDLFFTDSAGNPGAQLLYRSKEPDLEIVTAGLPWSIAMNRADLIRGQRGNRIGFALTILQRRLASSPEAIDRSIQRRRERLEERLPEMAQTRNVDLESQQELTEIPTNTEEADEFYDEIPAEEVEAKEEEVVARASAAGLKRIR